MQFGFIWWIAHLLHCANAITGWQLSAPLARPELPSHVELPFVRVIGRNSRTKLPYAGAAPTTRFRRKSQENGVFDHKSGSPGGVQSLERSKNDVTQEAPTARGNEFSVTRQLAPAPPPGVRAASAAGSAAEPKFLTERELARRERENLLLVLEAANWKVKGPGGAAELLGIKPTTLLSRMDKWGLKKSKPQDS
jgi:hypothetical protein